MSKITLYNGKTISTEYDIADSDNDGLSDGEEVRLEVKYSPDGNYATVVGHLISDPNEVDSDGDGIPDDKDTLKMSEGIENGIIGKLTIVSTGILSSYSSSSGSGDLGSTASFAGNMHSFLVYQSYIEDSINL